MRMNTNILVVGIGGQGVMTAAEVLARAALASGMDACKTEIAGMSQRGGVVSSQVRIGSDIHASEIARGNVDLLLSMEAAEALRWSHWLAAAGHVVVNTLRAVPPVVSSGRAHYPDDPVAQLLALGFDVLALDAGAIAIDLGDVRLTNSVMLGAASGRLPLKHEVLLAEILARFEGKEETRRRNTAAFAAGREHARLIAVSSGRPRTVNS
jgi:indolepyruvate ferredoxin oxidoreductase beta subunit